MVPVQQRTGRLSLSLLTPSATVQIPCTSESPKPKRRGFKIPPVVTEEDIDAFFSIGYRPPPTIKRVSKGLQDQAICAIRRFEIPIHRLPIVLQKKVQNLPSIISNVLKT